MKTFGENVKFFRGNRTQDWLAARLGVTQPAVAQIEHRRKPPRVATVKAYAQALEVPVYKLLQDTSGACIHWNRPKALPVLELEI